jgi:hypothetical protein
MARAQTRWLESAVMMYQTKGSNRCAILETLEQRRLLAADPGSTFATALNLGDLNGEITSGDSVGPSETTDIYKFTMPRDGEFFGRARANNAPAEIALIQEQTDNNGVVHEVFLDSRDATQDGPDAGFASGDLPEEFLTAGNYFLIITALGGDTSYLVRATADYAGNSLATARDIGSVTDNSFRDFIGEFPTPSLNDLFDTYRFKMDAPGLFDAKFQLDSTDETTFDAHMALIQDVNGNNVIDPGDTLVTTLTGSNGHIQTRLAAGTYILRLSADMNFSNYSLHLNADYAGSTADTVRNLGSLDKLKSVNDFISAPDDIFDDYKFTVSGTRPFFAAVSAQGATVTLDLFNDTNHDGVAEPGEQVFMTQGGSFETILRTVTQGQYILRVHGFIGSAVYTMSAETRPDGAGNTLSSAKNLGAVNGLEHLDDYVSDSDPFDFYKFTASAAGTIGASIFTEFGGNVDLALIRDANNNGKIDKNELLAAATMTTSGAKELTKSIAAGNYFLRVTSDNIEPGVTKYFLSFQTDYAGSTPETARNVGALSGSHTFNDWASGPFGGAISDTDDVYKFTLSSTKSFSAKMVGDHAGQDLDLFLYQDKNNDGKLTANEIIASSKHLNSPNEQISKSLSKGTYFVRVAGLNGETNYHLTLKA